jgi:hypothetical protein
MPQPHTRFKRIENDDHYVGLLPTRKVHYYFDDHGDHVPDVHGSIGASAAAPLFESLMYTWRNCPTKYQPIEHQTVYRTYGGNGDQPSWSNGTTQYSSLWGYDILDVDAGNSHLYNYIVPSRSLVDAAASLNPYFFREPLWDSYGWKQRFWPSLSELRAFRPSLSTGFSLINFLIQWADAKRIFKTFASYSGLRAKVVGIKRDLQTSGRIGIGRAANEWLEYQYGTKQFAQDCLTILRLIATWKDRADRFLSKAGTIQTHNFRLCPGAVVYDRTGDIHHRPFGVDGFPYQAFRFTEYAYMTWNGTVVYSFHIPKLRGVISRFGQLCDTFGVAFDPAVIWDAIPFTFVLDWFINLQDYFHSVREDWINAEIIYSELGRSAKITLDRYCNFVQGYSPDSLYNVTGVYNERRSVYCRKLVSLDQIFYPQPLKSNENWSLTRVLNATALAVQKIQKHQWTPRWGE